MKIAIVDTGVGNTRSVANMMRRTRLDRPVEILITDQASELEMADGLVLPGVGAFDAGMRKLHQSGLDEILSALVASGRPVMGLCLGMQLMLEGSEEGNAEGLGWIPGGCLRLPNLSPNGEKMRVPHMGWNVVEPPDDNVIYPQDGEEIRYYFDHSFALTNPAPGTAYGITNYGVQFAAGVRMGHLFGFQFHPERSHRFGLALFEQYLSYVEGQ